MYGCIVSTVATDALVLNPLQPSDAIWRHRTESTLAQAMACCLTAPSHYLNQRSLVINEVQCNHLKANLQEISLSLIDINSNVTHLKFHWNLPWANELKHQAIILLDNYPLSHHNSLSHSERSNGFVSNEWRYRMGSCRVNLNGKNADCCLLQPQDRSVSEFNEHLRSLWIELKLPCYLLGDFSERVQTMAVEYGYIKYFE